MSFTAKMKLKTALKTLKMIYPSLIGHCKFFFTAGFKKQIQFDETLFFLMQFSCRMPPPLPKKNSCRKRRIQ